MQVALIGGTGFVGSYLVDALLEAGHEPVLLVREGSEEKVQQKDRVRLVHGDISSPEALNAVIDGCDAVIYNVGILREIPSQGVTFEATQYDGAVRTVDAAVKAGVRRLLLMSANGVKQPGTPYQETKFRAEQYAMQSGLDVTVLRPSVIFGNPRGKMEFATQLYNDMVRLPVPAVGFFSGTSIEKGAVVMSPVHIEDVAAAFVVALENDKTIGQILSLGGPDELTWQEMIRRIAGAVGKSKVILPMPIGLMRLAATLLDRLPSFPVTRDQLTMLQEGNVAEPDALQWLTGRKPKSFSAENLEYLRS
jgi:NADH dehydrogenase